MLAAPASRRAVVTSSSTRAASRPLERHGQRQPAPGRRRAPARNAGQPVRRRPGRRRSSSPGPSRGVPGPVQRRRQRVGDRVAQHGAPHAAPSAARPTVSQYSRSSCLERQELLVVVGELGLAGLEVGGHVEEPVAVGRVRRRLDRLVTRAPRSARAAAPGACRCCTASRRPGLVRGQRDAEVAVERVVDRGVDLRACRWCPLSGFSSRL